MKKKGYSILAGVILLLFWQLLSMKIDKEIFLPSPGNTLKALFHLLQTKEFYLSVGGSCLRIMSGFVLALAAGTLLAVSAACVSLLRAVFDLAMQLMKAIPVASFVILVLLWIESAQLAIVISFLMVLPVVYTNVRDGIGQTDAKLLEMAAVFRLSHWKRIRYIYAPAVLPYFVSACSVGLGFCWKAGIAAEVIGLPERSIGEQLYEAKLYLMTPELFAWTAVIVMVSVLFEKLVMRLIRRLAK
ncbi:MAG: ABC transporter permease subunit [Lachnospiraceae bacterium]|nr:ABC transporter permease subunit [Lachnospiraceae bacterium]